MKKNKWGIRKLTERECARLQGFPDWFEIPVSTTQAYKQFGNSVSVPVIREIAKALKKTMRESSVPVIVKSHEKILRSLTQSYVA